MRGWVRRIVDLLVRREGWHINKIARLCFPLKFHMLAPAHHYLARNDVNDGFEFSMMMHSTRCLRLDDGDACPNSLRACEFARDRRSSLHPGRLRRIPIKFLRFYHMHGGHFHFVLCHSLSSIQFYTTFFFLSAVLCLLICPDCRVWEKLTDMTKDPILHNLRNAAFSEK